MEGNLGVMNRPAKDDVWRQMHGELTSCAQQVPSPTPELEKPKILFVFESPAEYELELDRPVTGSTGASLCVLCDMVRSYLLSETQVDLLRIAKGFCARRAIIVNVSGALLKRDGKPITASKLRKEEIQEYGNTFIDRMKDVQLESIEVVVFFGELAWRVRERLIDTLNASEVLICLECYHLSNKGINHIRVTGTKDAKPTRRQRIERLALYLSDRLREAVKPSVKSGMSYTIKDFKDWEETRGGV